MRRRSIGSELRDEAEGSFEYALALMAVEELQNGSLRSSEADVGSLESTCPAWADARLERQRRSLGELVVLRLDGSAIRVGG